MSTIGLDSIRKYSVNVSFSEAIDQLNEQLCHLLNNNQMHCRKRKNLLLQLERKNNQYRRSRNPSDLENLKKITNNTDLIQRIKRKIIKEEHQQQLQRRNEEEQIENNNWSLGCMTVLVGAALAIIISVATFIIMTLNNSKEKFI